MTDRKKQIENIAADNAIISENIVVHGNLNMGCDGGDVAPFSVVQVRLDPRFWSTCDSPRDGWKSLYPFDSPAKQYFYLDSHLQQQAPLFDILVRNNRDHPIIVLGLGFLIVETADVTYFYGGPSPRTFHITRDDVFRLQMPELKSMWPSLSSSYPPQKEDVETTKRNLLVKVNLDDPIGVEPRQPYRFGLELSDYVDSMPNNVIGKFIIQSDRGDVESDLLYMFTF